MRAVFFVDCAKLDYVGGLADLIQLSEWMTTPWYEDYDTNWEKFHSLSRKPLLFKLLLIFANKTAHKSQ